MITKYERTVLDLAAALAAQLVNAEDRQGQEPGHNTDERGTDLRLLRDAQHAPKGSVIRKVRSHK